MYAALGTTIQPTITAIPTGKVTWSLYGVISNTPIAKGTCDLSATNTYRATIDLSSPVVDLGVYRLEITYIASAAACSQNAYITVVNGLVDDTLASTANVIGYFQLGQDLPLWLRCRSGAVNVVPTAAPTATVAGQTVKLAPLDASRTDGLFRGKLFLGPAFSAGGYTVTFAWSGGSLQQTFTILPGGHTNGRIIGLYCYERPYATHLVMHTTRGIMTSGRNPSD
jgi:hypothetical protein